MKRSILVGASVLCAFVLIGCGATQKVRTDGGQPVSPSNQPIRFFAHTSPTDVKLILSSDPLVKQQIPDISPPKTPVIVYLPVYPGAAPTKPVTTIGDMGTPMNADLVDGTLYFESKDSQTQIKNWYTQEFQKLGYTISGQGQSGKVGNPTTDYFDFTKNGVPGEPTRVPDINLGFLLQKQNGKTIFKLKAYYIVVPPRPKNSYLPTDIVKVALTKGKVTKTVTDKQWIVNVIRAINSLQVSTPGISSGGPSVASGTITTVTAKFFGKDGSITSATFLLLSATVRVGNSDVALNSGSSPTLDKNIELVFGN